MTAKEDFQTLQYYIEKIESMPKKKISPIMLPMCRIIIDQQARIKSLERKLKK